MLLPTQVIDINKSSPGLNYKSNSTSPSNVSTTISSTSSTSSSIPNSPSCLVPSSSLRTFSYNNDFEEDKLNDQNKNILSSSYYYNQTNSNKFCFPSTIRSNIIRYHPYQSYTTKQENQVSEFINYEPNLNPTNNINNNNNEMNFIQQQSFIYGQQTTNNFKYENNNSDFYTNTNIYLQQYSSNTQPHHEHNRQQQQHHYFTINDNKLLNHIKNYNIQETQMLTNSESNFNPLYLIDYVNNNNNNNITSYENINNNGLTNNQHQINNTSLLYNENIINQLNSEPIQISDVNKNIYESSKVIDDRQNFKRFCVDKNNSTKSLPKLKSTYSNKLMDTPQNEKNEELKIKKEIPAKSIISNFEIINTIGGPKKRVSANKKERRRTQSINTAFSDLRNRIPHVPVDTKLSKIKTLKLATKYIEYLMDVLEQNDPVLLSAGFKPDLGKLRKESRSKEIKLEVERKAKSRTGWPQDVWATELKNKNNGN